MCGKGARKNTEWGELQSVLMFHSVVTSSQHGSALNYYTSHEYPRGKKTYRLWLESCRGVVEEGRKGVCVCVGGGVWGMGGRLSNLTMQAPQGRRDLVLGHHSKYHLKSLSPSPTLNSSCSVFPTAIEAGRRWWCPDPAEQQSFLPGDLNP